MLSEETKAKLRAIPNGKCSTCNSNRSYTNPLAKCFKCKKKFCYDHIWASLGKKGVEDYCDDCRKK